MTVCIAAIAERAHIIGFADRMVTTGVTQHTPPRSKIFPITDTVAAMIAGDIALATYLLTELIAPLNARMAHDPVDGSTVKAVTEEWAAVHRARWRVEAERVVLAPIGLTFPTWIASQQQLAPAVAERIRAELKAFELPFVSVIFAGKDASGPHLYVAEGDAILCFDARGYAAIGTGGQHARTELMAARHTVDVYLDRTVYSAYAAKRRAESAQGVGLETDNLLIVSNGHCNTLRQELLDAVRETFDTVEARRRELEDAALERYAQEFDRIISDPLVAHVQPDAQPLISAEREEDAAEPAR